MDIGYLMAWSNLGQWLSLLAMAPFDAIEGFGTSSSMQAVWSNYKAGVYCLFQGQDQNGAAGDSECEGLWQVFLLFVLFYVSANFANAANVKVS